MFLSTFALILELVFLMLFNILTVSLPVWFISCFILLFTVCFFYDINKNKRTRPVAKAIIVGYLFRIFLLYFDLFGRSIYLLPNSGYDSEMFYSFGELAARGVLIDKKGLIGLTSFAIRTIGNSRLYLQFLLMLCSIEMILVANYALVKLDINVSIRKKVLWFLVLLPNLAILSSVYLRESLVAMSIAFSILFYLYWWKQNKERDYWIALAFAICGAIFHSGAISIAFGMIISRLFCDRSTNRLRITYKSIISFLILAGVIYVLYKRFPELLFGKFQGIRSIEDISLNQDAGGASYASYVGNSDSIFNMIRYTPIRMIMFQFSPFIWQIRGISDIIAIIFDSFYFIYVYYILFKCLLKRKGEYHLLLISLTIIMLSTVFVFGWGVTNFGTALRHRNKMAALYTIILGISLEQRTINHEYSAVD